MIKLEMLVTGDLLTYLQAENAKSGENTLEKTALRILAKNLEIPGINSAPKSYREGLSLIFARRVLVNAWTAKARPFSSPDMGTACGLSHGEIVAHMRAAGFGVSSTAARYALGRLDALGHVKQDGLRRPNHITSDAWVITPAGLEYAIANDRTVDESDRTAWAMALADVRAGKVYS